MSSSAPLYAEDPFLQELIRGSLPGSSSSRACVAPLTDDEIGWFYCAICMETRLVLDRFRTACAHQFCVACLVRYIEGRVADGAVPVSCPAHGCGGGLHPEACKKLLDMDVFDAWCIALCEQAVGPGRARCPYRDCGELVVVEGGGGVARNEAESRVACPTCSREFCLQCEEPWKDRHGDGQGCALARLAEGRNWARCPSCRAMIDKNEGCNIMSCRCGTIFCYKCGMPSSREGCRCASKAEDAYNALTPLNPGSECKPNFTIDKCCQPS